MICLIIGIIIIVNLIVVICSVLVISKQSENDYYDLVKDTEITYRKRNEIMFTLKDEISWDVVKKEIYATVQLIDWLSNKMRVEIEYEDGYFNADGLNHKVGQFLEKLERIPNQELLFIDAVALRNVQSKLKLFVMSMNDFKDEEERRFLYYLLIKHESENGIAYVRTDYSQATLNRLKRVLFTRLLENMEYNKIMN